MSAAACLQLREQVANVRLDGLLREEEPLADLAVDQALGDQLQNLDLAHGGLLLQLTQGLRQRDDLGALAGALTPGRDLVELTGAGEITVQDVLALCSVHRQASIGAPRTPEYPRTREAALPPPDAKSGDSL